MNQTILQQLDVCEHRFPGVVVVPHKATFVLARWCIRCGDALFDEYDDQLDEIHVEEL